MTGGVRGGEKVGAAASARLLAQVNVSRLRADLGAREMSGFLIALDSVNQLADASAGFVWRLPAATGHAFSTPADGDARDVVNLSVWRSYEALHGFVYRSAHGALVRRRRVWFEPVAQPSTALWWIAPGHVPSLAEALARLAHLRRRGPTPAAFGLRHRFDPNGHRQPRRRDASGPR